MKVTQEIDALTTMGISPLEFLVLPRVLALVLMMPLLCVYSRTSWGFSAARSSASAMLDLAVTTTCARRSTTSDLVDFSGGIFKGDGLWRADRDLAAVCAASNAATVHRRWATRRRSAVVTVDRAGRGGLRHVRVVFNVLGI